MFKNIYVIYYLQSFIFYLITFLKKIFVYYACYVRKQNN